MLPTAGFYVLLVVLTQYTSWEGVASLYEQHAFLLPVPFMGWYAREAPVAPWALGSLQSVFPARGASSQKDVSCRCQPKPSPASEPLPPR